MFKILTHFRNYLGFRQSFLIVGLSVTSLVFGQTAPKPQLMTRMPASYVPDDDVIVKPVDNELSFYQKYVASDTSADVVNTRNQLKVWNDNQTFADQWNMDTSLAGTPYYVPTQKEKWVYFNNKYLRYLRARGEQPFKEMPKTWYEQYRASNEVDTIDELEGRFKKTTKKSSSGSSLPEPLQAKEVSVWKKTTLIFQPRLDQGMAIVGFKSPVAYARAWVGVNGKTEVNVQQSFDSIGFRAMYNYYANTGKYFTSFDQRIVENLYARFTSSKDPRHTPGTPYQDDTLMLLYARQF